MAPAAFFRPGRFLRHPFEAATKSAFANGPGEFGKASTDCSDGMAVEGRAHHGFVTGQRKTLV